MTEEQKIKDRARSYAGTYMRRGKIKKLGCQISGEPAQMHHPDYDKPLSIVWLCRKHHMESH